MKKYEEGYFEYFRTNPSVLDWLVTTASDVYDTDPSNVQAGLSYDFQETPNNHIHDVAIRNAVLRNVRNFNGDHLVHVRPEKEGNKLGPHKIPFHLPEMIYRGQTSYKGNARDFEKNPPWWVAIGVPDSVEMFYQQNKVLEIEERRVLQRFAIKVDKILKEEVMSANMKCSNLEARVYNTRTVGVQGDERTYFWPAEITLDQPQHRNDRDFTGDELYSLLEKLGNRVTNEVNGINRVLYVTDKIRLSLSNINK